MLFINLILIGTAISIFYALLSYIFKIRLTIFLIFLLTGIGNVIYLRWIDDNHIIFSIIVGLLAEYISVHITYTLYAILEEKLFKKYDLERPLCFMPQKCKKCGSTRLGENTMVTGQEWDNITITHYCNKCGDYWTEEC